MFWCSILIYFLLNYTFVINDLFSYVFQNLQKGAYCIFCTLEELFEINNINLHLIPPGYYNSFLLGASQLNTLHFPRADKMWSQLNMSFFVLRIKSDIKSSWNKLSFRNTVNSLSRGSNKIDESKLNGKEDVQNWVVEVNEKSWNVCPLEEVLCFFLCIVRH